VDGVNCATPKRIFSPSGPHSTTLFCRGYLLSSHYVTFSAEGRKEAGIYLLREGRQEGGRREDSAGDTCRRSATTF